MKALQSIVAILTVIFLIGCVNKGDPSSESVSAEQGLIGKWKCNTVGYESIIIIKEEVGQYNSLIDFEKEDMKSKSEVLIKKDSNKYMVLLSEAKEYYIINEDGNLELWDSEGLFTTAVNVTPGQESELPKFSVKKSIGENVFNIKNTYSKSSPETLEGTNNQYWIVYYKDLDVTFKTLKKTDIIQNAKSGKHPNL